MNQVIKQKLKICSGCGDPSRLWKSNPPLCAYCAGMARAKQAANKPHTPLKQTADGKVAKVFRAIPKVSPQMIKALKIYRVNRDEYFKEHPTCEYPGCGSRQVTLHHLRGRVGNFLTDKRWFCSLCPTHHTWVNENNDAAFKMGLAYSRLEKIKGDD